MNRASLLQEVRAGTTQLRRPLPRMEGDEQRPIPQQLRQQLQQQLQRREAAERRQQLQQQLVEAAERRSLPQPPARSLLTEIVAVAQGMAAWRNRPEAVPAAEQAEQAEPVATAQDVAEQEPGAAVCCGVAVSAEEGGDAALQCGSSSDDEEDDDE